MTIPQTAFSISLIENLLSVNLNPETPQSNSQIARNLLIQLNNLKQSGSLQKGPLLKITGKHSIPMGYVITHALSAHFGAIAIYDPAINGYIVAISQNSSYGVGDIIHA